LRLAEADGDVGEAEGGQHALSTADSSCAFGSVTVTVVRSADILMAWLFSCEKSTWAMSVPCPTNSEFYRS
jgi:hypothetical protein